MRTIEPVVEPVVASERNGERLDERSSSPPWIPIAVVILVVAALYFAQDLLIPFALAMMLCFVLGPLVAWLERWHIHRVAAVVIAVTLACTAAGGIGWMVIKQVTSLATSLPEYRENIRKKIGSLRGGSLEQATAAVEKIGKELKQEVPASQPDSAPDPAQPAAAAESRPQVTDVRIVNDGPDFTRTLQGTLPSVLSLFGTASVVVVISIFLLIQRSDLRDRLLQLIGYGRLHVTTQALDEITSRVSRYLLAQTLLNAGHGAVVGVGLYFLGLPEPFLWGFLGGVMRFIPYIGPLIADVAPILLALAVFEDWSQPLMVVAFFVVVELISNNVAEPLILGRSSSVSTFAVIAMAVFWTWLWGAAGLVLAMPLTVCLVVIGRYVPQLHFLDTMFSDEPELDPVIRIYQRVLGLDRAGVLELTAKELKEERSLAQIFDSLLVPALRYFKVDRQRGNLDEAKATEMLRFTEEMVDELAESVRKERDTAAAKAAAKADAVAPAPRAVRSSVLILPARDQADHIVGKMLAAILDLSGVHCELAPAEALATEKAMLIEKHDPQVVLISALPPAALIAARYLVKRVEPRAANARVLIGLWTVDREREDLVDQLGCQDTCSVLTSLTQAEQEIGHLTLLDRVPAEPAAALQQAQ